MTRTNLGIQHKYVVKLSYHANSSDIKCVPILKGEGEGSALAQAVTSWQTLKREGGGSLSFSSVSNVWGWDWAVSYLSADVNFALELSDLRHRHGFHIILIHKNQASEALLHHANELIRFEEFISDLPPRSPLKMPVSEFAFSLLYSSTRLGRLKEP